MNAQDPLQNLVMRIIDVRSPIEFQMGHVVGSGILHSIRFRNKLAELKLFGTSGVLLRFGQKKWPGLLLLQENTICNAINGGD